MKITWFSRLYVGEKAKRKRYRIIRGIRKSKPQPGVYVITPALNGNNILDIYPSKALISSIFREEFLVMGIAADYWEALEVAGHIVSDLYRETGDFSLPAFIKEEIGKV